MIVAAHEELLTDPRFRGTRGGAMPIVLPGAIEHDPIEAPTVSPEIPLLIGNTADEATFLFRAAGRNLQPDDRMLAGIVSHQRGVTDPAAVIATYREQHPGADNNELLCRIVTDKLFAEPVAEFATKRAAAGAEVYRLRIEHQGPDDAPRLHPRHRRPPPLRHPPHRPQRERRRRHRPVRRRRLRVTPVRGPHLHPRHRPLPHHRAPSHRRLTRRPASCVAEPPQPANRPSPLAS